MQRCDWVGDNELMQAYHDQEWGRPQHEPQKLFELLCLETYQAGLSWQTVLNKRAAFREDFYQYDIDKVAAMTDEDVERLLGDARIIRHRQKLVATINNAQMIQTWSTPQAFSDWVWSFVDGQPIRQAWATAAEIPSTDERAKQLSKALKQHGFKFVGPTTIYSFMQGAGLVNDHLQSCDWV
ncbi:DNA-3-methyladenine glycosylase I [Lactiplantibacillus mudanjiangensis]|uniref:DNA-3-methyladenine glycosylase I [Lactobacillus pentosus] n=1 Tax=Lactiplantibacillus mudanjiangensis TaxID=1296538 RepID=A0A660E0I1_9LACO|nr:DNA-3-methyladenine glycosylase I [Lactiplantibacillus mudanjiangensis]VDG21108.1 DNA-3-methyladenine glycosylase I [Lactobacillus pentosus] [Lactiplantibacillus mudanjiangensis]VDG22959.1 DNA-3-methyladenine glycosylase I [Lactobacillus pentosus] [Lactiplantibacillus mudanjiangensis]VDG29184.1 DNA-3-methyladenine glycosylase I [Lactobacillus pentosus] [Lactiplantibacillus mudanjiangensis]